LILAKKRNKATNSFEAQIIANKTESTSIRISVKIKGKDRCEEEAYQPRPFRIRTVPQVQLASVAPILIRRPAPQDKAKLVAPPRIKTSLEGLGQERLETNLLRATLNHRHR